MPYINVRVSKLEEDAIQKTVDALTDIVRDVLGKGEDTIMVDVELAENLFIGKKKMPAGAMIQIQSYGFSELIQKEQLNTMIVDFFEDNLGIKAKNIYVTFTDRSEWGYRGMFLS